MPGRAGDTRAFVNPDCPWIEFIPAGCAQRRKIIREWRPRAAGITGMPVTVIERSRRAVPSPVRETPGGAPGLPRPPACGAHSIGLGRSRQRLDSRAYGVLLQ
ncbi:hypothetical protein [Burkholderia stagnalis]|uniref:hypothetical protein n=1 Tax=Burkholderia stagnalis TaxID=1503054 RepID=UPI000ACE5898|nr:hypothetical protein [Burkholderia stagnalis]